MSKEMSYQGRLVAVIERKGGWTTILDGMKQLKVRNTELSTPIDGRPNVPAKTAPPKAAKKTAAKKTAAKKAAKAAPKADDQAADQAADRLVKPDLNRYKVSEIKTASGRKAIDIGDDVATRLRGLDLAEVYEVAAEETGYSTSNLETRYRHLNPGMQRMNLGNLIRGARSKRAKSAAS